MRERYLEAFDVIRIDNLNGDKYKTGKTTPDGAPDPSIFSTPSDPVGIQVGTAITTLVRKADHEPAKEVGFRHLWGQTKLSDLTATAEAGPDELYDSVEPSLPLGLPFTQTTVSDGWAGWPLLPNLFPTYFPGVVTNRDAFLVDIDLDNLKARIADYFNREFSHEEIARRYPVAMKTTSSIRLNAQEVREERLHRGHSEEGFVPYSFRPFDMRWLYWEEDSGLLARPSPDYRPHIFKGNKALVSQQKPRREWSPPQVITEMGCYDLMDRNVSCFPLWLREEGMALDGGGEQRRPNLSGRGATLPGPPRPGRGGPLPPRPRRSAQPLLPGGQRRRSQDGVAPHSAAGLARRRRSRSGGRADSIRGAGPGACRAA